MEQESLCSQLTSGFVATLWLFQVRPKNLVVYAEGSVVPGCANGTWYRSGFPVALSTFLQLSSFPGGAPGHPSGDATGRPW